MSFMAEKIISESGDKSVWKDATLHSYFYLIKKFETDTILRDMLFSLAVQVLNLDDKDYYYMRMTHLDTLQFAYTKEMWQFSLCVWKATDKKIIESLENKFKLIERRILK